MPSIYLRVLVEKEGRRLKGQGPSVLIGKKEWCRGAESNCRHHDFQSGSTGGPKRNNAVNTGQIERLKGTGRTQIDPLGCLPVILRSSRTHGTNSPLAPPRLLLDAVADLGKTGLAFFLCGRLRSSTAPCQGHSGTATEDPECTGSGGVLARGTIGVGRHLLRAVHLLSAGDALLGHLG